MDICKEIKVSVLCLAYNHGKYIRNALDGFVMQQTNFAFEVLIHDDASTDDTAEIIREYAAKYDFIKPIFQTENMYSQKISISKEYLYPAVKGKYIAFCEGDDYWTDANKLQIQADYMDSHPACSMCCHSYDTVSANDGSVVEHVATLDNEGIITAEDAIWYKKPSQLASQMFRADVILKMPELFYNVGVGDYPLLLKAACSGEIHYFAENMAAHRVMSEGSWTVRVYQKPQLQIQHWDRVTNFLNRYDKYCEYKYHDIIDQKLDEIDYIQAMLRGDYKSAKETRRFKTVSLARKLIIYFGCVCPGAAKKLEQIRDSKQKQG